MIVGKISKKGQIVIPKEIRERLRIKPNDILSFNVRGKGIYIKIVKEDNGESIVNLLERCKPFNPNLLQTLRNEWS
jgi:AbrB family looped-hinge helix DNA binding protein